ncbi:transposable element Tcb2 transposase [Trichonephila clavipes]|nr:transposable element Tcb2 transposase [Trichonephila clavipes]
MDPVQAGGDSVTGWGVCSWRDMEPLICLDTTLTDDRYVSILSDLLHPFMSIEHSDELGEFQQDSVIPHTSRIDTE